MNTRRLRWAVAIALLSGGAAIGVVLMRSAGELAAPAPPSATADEPLIAEQPLSAIDVPVSLDVSLLSDVLEERVPVQWVEDSVRGPDDGPLTAMAFTRGAFSGSVEGDVARLSTTVAYALRTSYSLPLLPDVPMSCGTDPNEPAPRMDIRVEAPMRLTSEWRLRSETRLVEIAPTTDTDRDNCEVTIFGVDITERVRQGMASFISGHTTAIDSLVTSVELRSQFGEWWSALSRPIELHEDVWLDIRPESIARGAIRGRGETLEVVAGLLARPRIVFGARPTTESRPLPALGDSIGGSGFEVLVDVLGDYGELGEALTDEFRGTEFSGAGRSTRIDRVTVSGIGANRIAVDVLMSGDVEGSLYLVGTPSYGREDGYVRMTDLALTVSTSNWLVAGASWLLDTEFERYLRGRTRWPVENGISWAADQIEVGLNASLTDELRLEGRIGSLEVLEVYARSEGALIRARATGTLEMFVEDR